MTWLAEAPQLSGLGAEAKAVLARLSPVQVPQGTALFHPGDVAQGFVVVLQGRVDVFMTGSTGRDILLYSVEPGQSCIQSTLGLLGGEAYSGEAITCSDCRLVLVPRPQFMSLMNSSAEFRGIVFAAFAQRMQSMMTLLDRLAFQKVESRLARLLLERAEHGHLHATQAEIAVMIGSAREVVTRRLDAMAKRGLVRLERGTVHLVALEDLQALAEE
ncbi:Crp/Fnr family transcriptional regulator [Pseudoprimorskyibacter insulae]|uniref:Cyclic AMP receptor protein n=1 Tax=Pseudoprimorskyibacter insulae TaxID=1695997 RepID=A0A2R8AXL0_9RHOB|nr:Crp/Fnr family transcriptional regulator [Pseudoprimorskyibacter insulae]SPF80771.1 Cyclic AMP receptor protein [Pseudoprimorskyibacter insulae]